MKKGELIPNVNLRLVSSDGTKDINLHDNFKNKRVLIICIPGAFTSTCHIQHLPPFISGAEKIIEEKKLDLICCITTNDPYVLDLWRKELGDSKIKYLSDGNEEFMKLSKLQREYENNFMGTRLIRSIILLEDLEVINIITEDPGEFKKTSFEAVLNSI
tara:strand:+ start:345 stop:821 length:477 start_codon:yes stop_codon:yes gene_type:complete